MILNSQYSRARVAFHFPQQVKEQVITPPYAHFMWLGYSSRVSRFHRWQSDMFDRETKRESYPTKPPT